MLVYLRLELVRMLSDVKFIILMLLWPIGMYLLFTNLFSNSVSSANTGGLSPAVGAMVSMAAFGAIGAVLAATAPWIAQERAVGWFRQLRVLPLRPSTVIGLKIVSAMVWALPAIVLVDLTAVINHGVTLMAWQWLSIGALLWIGTAPFAALGVCIGYLTDHRSAFAIMYGLYLALSAIGGLWMPVSVLPAVLRSIAPALPTNRLAEFGWRIASGDAPSFAGTTILFGWLLVFTVVAWLAYRRTNAVR
jgi:ABC-2 type transport system permease protein